MSQTARDFACRSHPTISTGNPPPPPSRRWESRLTSRWSAFRQRLRQREERRGGCGCWSFSRSPSSSSRSRRKARSDGKCRQPAPPSSKRQHLRLKRGVRRYKPPSLPPALAIQPAAGADMVLSSVIARHREIAALPENSVNSVQVRCATPSRNRAAEPLSKPLSSHVHRDPLESASSVDKYRARRQLIM